MTYILKEEEIYTSMFEGRCNERRYSIKSGRPRSSSVGLLGEIRRRNKDISPIISSIGVGIGTIRKLDLKSSRPISSSIKAIKGAIKWKIAGEIASYMISAMIALLGKYRRDEVETMNMRQILREAMRRYPLSPMDYVVNNDPTSFDATVSFKNGVMILALKEDKKKSIESLSDYLDDLCYSNRYSSYKSEKKDGFYMVTIMTPDKDEAVKVLSKVMMEFSPINIIPFPDDKI